MRLKLASTLLSAIIFATAVFNCAFAGSFEDAMAAYERGDYATAVRLVRPLAEQAYAAAQYNLGVMYYLGRGVPQNYAEAAEWYQRAAAQGYADAQYNLGGLYDLGRLPSRLMLPPNTTSASCTTSAEACE